MTYEEFIQNKKHSINDSGIELNYLPDITHPQGLKRYFGETPILPNILQAWNNANKSNLNASQLWEHLNNKYQNHKDPKSNKLSHYIWQRYASSVWDDIRIDKY